MFFQGIRLGIVALPGNRFGVVEERLAPKALAADIELHIRAVRIHRDAAMEQEVAVIGFVKAAL